jgi:diguanylate cyclase (GGDEF)-like protein/PAS domain S-box-containing protein
VDNKYKQLISRLPATAICDVIGIGITLTDPDFLILYQNDAHKKIFGDHAGERCYTAYAGNVGICENCPLSNVFKDGGIHTAEWTISTGTEQLYFDITASALMAESGEVIAGVELFRDITHRKQMEAKLRESEQHFRTIFDSSLVGIVFADSGGRPLQTNPSFQKMLGYTQDELSRGFVQITHPDDAKESLKLFHYVANGKLNNFKAEKRYLRKDGSIMWGNTSATAIKDGKGNFKYAVAMIEDISERKRIENKIQAAAVSDELTGLFNRRGFFTLAEHQINIAARLKKRMSLLYLDLDNLKLINDELGHKTGDEALWGAAGIIKSSVRKSDVIARIGGDEFAVLLTDLSAPDTEEAVISHLHRNLDEYNTHCGRCYKLSLSIGTSKFDPHNPCSVDALLSQADVMMYKEKHTKHKDHSIHKIAE